MPASRARKLPSGRNGRRTAQVRRAGQRLAEVVERREEDGADALDNARVDHDRVKLLERGGAARKDAEDEEQEAGQDGPDHGGNASIETTEDHPAHRRGFHDALAHRLVHLVADLHAERLHSPDRLVERRLAPDVGRLEPHRWHAIVTRMTSDGHAKPPGCAATAVKVSRGDVMTPRNRAASPCGLHRAGLYGCAVLMVSAAFPGAKHPILPPPVDIRR